MLCFSCSTQLLYSQALLKQKRDATKQGTELVQYKEKLGTQIEEQEKKLQMMEKEVTTKLSNAPSIYCVAFGLLVLSRMGFLMCVCV